MVNSWNIEPPDKNANEQQMYAYGIYRTLEFLNPLQFPITRFDNGILQSTSKINQKPSNCMFDGRYVYRKMFILKQKKSLWQLFTRKFMTVQVLE